MKVLIRLECSSFKRLKNSMGVEEPVYVFENNLNSSKLKDGVGVRVKQPSGGNDFSLVVRVSQDVVGELRFEPLTKDRSASSIRSKAIAVLRSGSVKWELISLIQCFKALGSLVEVGSRSTRDKNGMSLKVFTRVGMRSESLSRKWFHLISSWTMLGEVRLSGVMFMSVRRFLSRYTVAKKSLSEGFSDRVLMVDVHLSRRSVASRGVSEDRWVMWMWNILLLEDVAVDEGLNCRENGG